MKKNINEYRAESTLNKKFRYAEGIMTRRRVRAELSEKITYYGADQE